MAGEATVSSFRGYPLFTGNGAGLASALKKMLKGRGRGAVYYLNPHVFNLAHKDPVLRQCLRRATCLLADGGGLLWAARWDGVAVRERLALSDHLHTVAAAAAAAKKSVFLWGGVPGVAEAAARELTRRHRGLKIAGTAHGFQGGSGKSKVFNRLRRAKASVLVAGMGTPVQEMLCDELRQKAGGPRLYVTVGNALAYVGGLDSRAPEWLQRPGVEWLWRLVSNPLGMWRRYLLGNPLFLFRVLFRTKPAGHDH